MQDGASRVLPHLPAPLAQAGEGNSVEAPRCPRGLVHQGSEQNGLPPWGQEVRPDQSLKRMRKDVMWLLDLRDTVTDGDLRQRGGQALQQNFLWNLDTKGHQSLPVQTRKEGGSGKASKA